MFGAVGRFIIASNALVAFVTFFISAGVPFKLTLAMSVIGALSVFWILRTLAGASRRPKLRSWADDPLPGALASELRPGLPSTAASEPARPDADTPLARIPWYERRFEEAEAPLAPRLPADPLDNPAMLDVTHLYLHEPAEEVQRLHTEYHATRERFLRWRSELARLREVRLSGSATALANLPRLYEQLDAELTEIQAYLTALDARAAEAHATAERAVQMNADAAAALADARTVYQQAAARHPLPDLQAQVARADELLREATEALRRPQERPVTALRLATEARDLAVAAVQRARAVSDLPATLARRGQELDSAAARVTRELVEAKEAFQAAAEEYAPSCWLEVRGAGAAAERALERAAERRRAAADAVTTAGADVATMEQAAVDLDEAFTALGQASELIGSLTRHLAALEAAALNARRTLEAAETEIDQARVFVGTLAAPEETIRRREALLERAVELALRSRDELRGAQPDWLAAVGWAERARDLAAQVQTDLPRGQEQAGSQRGVLAGERERAKAARDRALALAWSVESASGDATRMLIDTAQIAYQRAENLDAAAATAAGSAEEAQALQIAIDAYRSAEDLATTAYERIRRDLLTERIDRGNPQNMVARAVVWGAIGMVAGGILGGDSSL